MVLSFLYCEVRRVDGLLRVHRMDAVASDAELGAELDELTAVEARPWHRRARGCLGASGGGRSVADLKRAMLLLSAPTNLGLRPPEAGAVPGTAKAPEALREAGLWSRLAINPMSDLGVVLPARYRDDAAPAEQRLRNQAAIVDFSHRLGRRLREAPAAEQVVVLGGDCSILVGIGLHLRRRGRYALVHIDGHSDFRNPSNSDHCESLAGEDLAAVIGRHWPSISDIDGLSPYFGPRDVIQIGARPGDEHLGELCQSGISVIHPARLETDYVGVIRAVHEVVGRPGIEGYWLHLDVDVLDPATMPAVDSPTAGGLMAEQLIQLLRDLWPAATGIDVTIFDPDLDNGGSYAALLTGILATGLMTRPVAS